MGDFGVFPAPEQSDFLQQRHLRRWAENFQKVWYEKKIEKVLEKLLSFPEIYFGHPPAKWSLRNRFLGKSLLKCS